MKSAQIQVIARLQHKNKILAKFRFANLVMKPTMKPKRNSGLKASFN